MADRGEFPPVGSTAQYESTFFTMDKFNNGTCKPIAYFGGKVWIDIDGGQESVISLAAITFKPIDTRTPKQKAVDAIVKMLHSEGIVMFDPIMLHIMYEKGFIKTDKEA
jgi:hypothetical protein